MRRHKSKAKCEKYLETRLKIVFVANPPEQPKQVKKAKRRAEQASLDMADDGKRFEEQQSSSGRIRKVQRF